MSIGGIVSCPRESMALTQSGPNGFRLKDSKINTLASLPLKLSRIPAGRGEVLKETSL